MTLVIWCPRAFGRSYHCPKAYGGLSSSFRYVETPTGSPMPWPSTDPTGISGKYITEMQQLGFGGDMPGTDYQFGQGMLNAWTIVSGVILASCSSSKTQRLTLTPLLVTASEKHWP